MNHIPKQFTRNTANDDDILRWQTIEANDEFSLNADSFLATIKYQTDIDPEAGPLFVASNLLSLINCISRKETICSPAFPISKMMYSQEPIKLNL